MSRGGNLAPEELESLLRLSEQIPGWTRGEQAAELARVSFQQGENAVVVEIGSFMGSGTVLLAGARAARGTGRVYTVDRFDCSGDAFSVPHYRRIFDAAGGGSLRSHFEDSIRRARLSPWVEVHQGDASDIAATWVTPIDLLYLDGDQSRAGARAAYDSWSPFLKPGGVIAIHNTNPDNNQVGHDGSRYLVETVIYPPLYSNIRRVGAITFAVRATASLRI